MFNCFAYVAFTDTGHNVLSAIKTQNKKEEHATKVNHRGRTNNLPLDNLMMNNLTDVGWKHVKK